MITEIIGTFESNGDNQSERVLLVKTAKDDLEVNYDHLLELLQERDDATYILPKIKIDVPINDLLEGKMPGGKSLNPSGQTNINIDVSGSGSVELGDVVSSGSEVNRTGESRVTSVVNIESAWDENKESVDLGILATELGSLLTQMKADASTGAHYMDMGHVVEAEKAAKEGNGPKALEYLSKVGKWTLDRGSEIGTKWVLEAAKSAMGLS